VDATRKQIIVYRGTGDPQDLWVGFSEDVLFHEAVLVMDALANLADERDLWVYVVSETHSSLLVWSQQNASVWEPVNGLRALSELPGFWDVIRSAPLCVALDPPLTAPLLLGSAGVPDEIDARFEGAAPDGR
jgi:hypothetical protein